MKLFSISTKWFVNYNIKKKKMKAHKKYEQETCGMQESKMQLMEAGQSRLQGTSFV